MYERDHQIAAEDNIPASARQTMVSRSECGSLTTRPSISVMAVSATPSSTPAKIRNRVAANVQANSNSVANRTTPMPPGLLKGSDAQDVAAYVASVAAVGQSATNP